MPRHATVTVLLLVSAAAAIGGQVADRSLIDRAKALHKQVPFIDGHNDYPWAVRENVDRDVDRLDITKPQPAIHTDIARLREGGVGGQFWSVYVSPDTMEDAIRVAQAPVIFSHSSAREITDVPRNVPDNVLRLLPKNGGVV